MVGGVERLGKIQQDIGVEHPGRSPVLELVC